MAERVKEKVQAKKAGVASITKLRKQRQRDGFAGELDLDAELAGPGARRKPAMTPGQRIRPGMLLAILFCKNLLPSCFVKVLCQLSIKRHAHLNRAQTPIRGLA